MAVLSRAETRTATESVKEQLQRAILGGAYPPGSRLPPEKELVKIFGISRATLREALRAIEEQGLIIRRHGVGTFVSARPIQRNLSLNFGITNRIRSAGFVPGTAHFAIHTQAAGDEESELLQLTKGDPLVVVERVHTADDQPVAHSLDIIPASLIGGQEHKEALALLRDRSISWYFYNELGLSIHHGLARLMPVRARADLSRHLNVPRGTPLLYMRWVNFLSDEQPVLLSHEYHRADAFEITVLTVYRNEIRGMMEEDLARSL